MDINSPKNQNEPGPGLSHVAGANPIKIIWEKFRDSKYFPIGSIVIVGVIIFGLGFMSVWILNQFGALGKYGSVPGPKNVSYAVDSESNLTLTVVSAAYQEKYNDSVPLAPGRKFVVVNFEIKNGGGKPSSPLTNSDMRLITPDNSIMAPSTWSKELLNYGVGAGQTKKGQVVFDIDERNSQKPLGEYRIAFGKNPGSRAMYNLGAQQ